MPFFVSLIHYDQNGDEDGGSIGAECVSIINTFFFKKKWDPQSYSSLNKKFYIFETKFKI